MCVEQNPRITKSPFTKQNLKDSEFMEMSVLWYVSRCVWWWGGILREHKLGRMEWTVCCLLPNTGWLLWSDHRGRLSCPPEGNQVGTVRPHCQCWTTSGIHQPRDCEWAVYGGQKENCPNLHLPREELWTRQVCLSRRYHLLGFFQTYCIMCLIVGF